MELSSSEMKTIQHQYDALAKKVLKGEARSYYRELSKRAALEVNFSEMSEAELSQLYTLDEYESDYYRFEVSGYDVLVKNELLGEALQDCHAPPSPPHCHAAAGCTLPQPLLLPLLDQGMGDVIGLHVC